MNKDFRAVDPSYDQDWINGITEREYEKLFSFLFKKNITTILDLAGGTGKLTRKLLDRGYDALLFDSADNMTKQAVRAGVPSNKVVTGNLFNYDFRKKFDCVILKSATHEIPPGRIAELHLIIFKLLNSGGWFIDWDVHQPTRETASWLKQWVNAKDAIAGLDELVKNRAIYSEDFIQKSISMAGFKNIEVVHRFFYTLSVLKMSNVYWGNDIKKTKDFFMKTRDLIKTAPKGILAKEIAPMDIEIKVPAVIFASQK